MKNIRIVSLLLLLFLCLQVRAQDTPPKTGFYFQPEYSAMFLDAHVGRAVGYQMGVRLLNRHLDIGVRYLGRSGPINLHQEYALVLDPGETYNGKSVLYLGADHGYFGIEAAYNLWLKDDRILLRFPFSFGQVGAGFYLKGEDRNTPDGRRVSEWEDELQNGTDAGFGFASEVGASLFALPFKQMPYLRFGAGLHYTNTYGYSSFLGGDDFYNNKLRISMGFRVDI